MLSKRSIKTLSNLSNYSKVNSSWKTMSNELLVKFNETAEELNKGEFLVNNKLIEHKSFHKVLGITFAIVILNGPKLPNILFSPSIPCSWVISS